MTSGPLIVRVVDGGPTSIESIDAACELIEQMLQQYPAIALLVIVEHGTPVLPLAVRRHAAERFGAYGARVLLGVCMLGLGFWAKAAFNSMTMALRFTGPVTLLLEYDVASFARQVSYELVGVDPDALVALVEQQRHELRARAASVA